MTKIAIRCAVLAMALASHAGAFAQERACLIEGSMNVLGKRIDIRDCLQNDGIPKEQFLENCKGIAGAAAAMGAPPSKITYLAACPAAAQASCKGLLGAPLSAFYYKQDAEALADAKKSCLGEGGKWSGS
jgi:hypothetical protein